VDSNLNNNNNETKILGYSFGRNDGGGISSLQFHHNFFFINQDINFLKKMHALINTSFPSFGTWDCISQVLGLDDSSVSL
jgi:hypothetical protein